MDRVELRKSFIKMVDIMKRNRQDGVWIGYLDHNVDGKDYALVLDWQDGYDPDVEYGDGTYGLCAKIAYQPSNSVMQSDYDIDWSLPTDSLGDVLDYEISFYAGIDVDKAFDWLMECWDEFTYNNAKVYILDTVVTREQYDEMSFESVMDILNEHDDITTKDCLLDYVKYLIDQDNLRFAMHILEAVYDSEPAEWYQYDYSMGTFDTPTALTCKEDIEHLLEEVE